MQKLILQSSGDYRHIDQNGGDREALKCCFLCIFLKNQIVFYVDSKK